MTSISGTSALRSQETAWLLAFVVVSILLMIAVLYKGLIAFGLLPNPPFTFANFWNLIPIVIGVWFGNKAMAPHTVVVFGCAGYVGPKWIIMLSRFQIAFSVLALILLFF